MTNMEIDKRVRVGLVGAGTVSAFHARALKSLPFVEIVGIADPETARAEQVAARFGIPRTYASLQEMADARPAVIHILTPPETHAALALEALEMGCHVFVEMPLAETVADCDRMIELAHDRGLVLSVNHSARMDPIVSRALTLLHKGVCGEITGADFFRSSHYPPYAGGPVVPPQFRNGSYPFQDLGAHGLYLLEAFLGPIRRAAIRYYANDLGDPNLLYDEWRALVECQNGTGTIYLSWNVRPTQNEIVVYGTRGVMRVDCYLRTLAVRKVYPGPEVMQRILSAALNPVGMLWNAAGNAVRFATRRQHPAPGIQVSVIGFHEALRKGDSPPVPVEEGRRIVALLEEVSQRADADKRRYLAEPEPAQLPRVLVTGANGFLGRALVRRLRQPGEAVRVQLRRPWRMAPSDDIQAVYGDLGNPETADRAVRCAEVVFHLASAMKGGPSEFQSGTVWGTRNIVEACARHGVRRLVYVSSMAVLDHAAHLPGVPANEASPCEPNPRERGLYTQTKLEAERMVLQAAAENRIRAVVLRPGQIYGPGAENAPPGGTIEIAGRWLVGGSGEHHLPVVYVENVLDAMLLAARADVPNGSIFQLVDPEGIRQRDYIDCMRRSGRNPRVWYVPGFILRCAAWCVELIGRMTRRSVPLTPYRVRSVTPLWPCDCTEAHTQLGWKPRVGIREGMAATFPKMEQD
jgi:2-alkyl-3-oxoalkanoate reductase